MKHLQYFDDFLADHVNLNQARLDRLESRVGTITKRLKENHEGYKKYSQQGSYAHKTIIKPVQENDQFDADVLIFVQDEGFDSNEFTDHIDAVYQTLKADKNYASKISRKSRCVMIDYADDFCLDLVPCIEHDNSSYICNRKEEKYERTDGDGYKEWLIGKNRVVGGNNFRKTTRLLKFLRDHKDNFSVKSIVLTTMLGNEIDEQDRNSGEFSDLPTALKTLSNRVNDFLQGHPTMPTIRNPILPSENFNRHWDEQQYTNFRSKFDTYNAKINDAFAEQNPNESVKKWRNLFGDGFRKLTPSGKSGAIAGGVAIPAVAATKPYAHD